MKTKSDDEINRIIASWYGWEHYPEKTELVCFGNHAHQATIRETWRVDECSSTEVDKDPTKYCDSRDLIVPLLEYVPESQHCVITHEILCRTAWASGATPPPEYDLRWSLLTASPRVIAEVFAKWIEMYAPPGGRVREGRR